VLYALLIIIATFITVGIASGGRLSALALLRPRASGLAFVALAVMVVAPFIDGIGPAADRALIGVTYALVAAFLALNVGRRDGWARIGIVLLIVGWTLNALVIGLNRGMPLSLDAYRASGQTAPPTPGEGGFFKLVIADDSTLLLPLGDVIPVHPLRQVFSAGDLVLLAGLGTILTAGMHQRGSTT